MNNKKIKKIKKNKFDDPEWRIIPNLKLNKNTGLECKHVGNYDIADIKNYVQNISDEFKQAGREGKIGVAINYSLKHWRRAYMSKFGDNIDMFEAYEEHEEIADDFITGFIIYIIK